MENNSNRLSSETLETMDSFGYLEDANLLEEVESILSPAVFVGPWFFNCQFVVEKVFKNEFLLARINMLRARNSFLCL